MIMSDADVLDAADVDGAAAAARRSKPAAVTVRGGRVVDPALRGSLGAARRDRHPPGVPGRDGEALPRREARGERRQRDAHRRGDRHAPLEPLQEDRPLRPAARPRGRRAVTPEAVRRHFEETGALLSGHFKLSSGLHADTYLQCARVLQHPDRAGVLGAALAALLAPERPRGRRLARDGRRHHRARGRARRWACARSSRSASDGSVRPPARVRPRAGRAGRRDRGRRDDREVHEARCSTCFASRGRRPGRVRGRSWTGARPPRRRPPSTAFPTARSCRSRSRRGSPRRARCARAGSPSSRPGRGISRRRHDARTPSSSSTGRGTRAARPGSTATFGGRRARRRTDPVAEVVVRVDAGRRSAARVRDGAVAGARVGAPREVVRLPVLPATCPCRAERRSTSDVRLASGAEVPAFRYDVAVRRTRGARASRRSAARVAALPAPDSVLVATTQGQGTSRRTAVDPRLVPRRWSLLLGRGGRRPRARALPCWTSAAARAGSSRAGTPTTLSGGSSARDLNRGPDRVGARATSASVATWEVNGLRPPLAHPDGGFDLVLAVVRPHPPLPREPEGAGSRRSGGSSRRADTRS